MRPALELRTRQQLALSPQLQQAIQLLQLPQLDLREHLQEALESNLLLEVEEPEAPVSMAEDDPVEPPDRGHDGETAAEEWPQAQAGGSSGSGAGFPEPVLAAPPPGLREHLAEQLALAGLSPAEMALAEAVVEALDDDGYLTEPLDELAAFVGCGLDEAACEALLAGIQQLDPVGVAARDLSECLRAQLAQLAADTEGLDCARDLLDEEGLALLARRDWSALTRRTGADRGSLEVAAALIRRLNPRPGSSMPGETAAYVTPDVTVRRVDGRWRVELNDGSMPRLRVNQAYADALRRDRDAVELKGQLQEARWLVRSLQLRNETLLRVASAIVEAQRGFLEDGEIAMKPLVLRDIAEQVDLHESTISRVASGKYMRTPRGIFEFRYFFSSQLATTDGGEASATAIRAVIRELISAEESRRPLSDNRIGQMLEEKGYKVARRTVTKYREAMDIPSSPERRRQAR